MYSAMAGPIATREQSTRTLLNSYRSNNITHFLTLQMTDMVHELHLRTSQPFANNKA